MKPGGLHCWSLLIHLQVLHPYLHPALLQGAGCNWVTCWLAPLPGYVGFSTDPDGSWDSVLGSLHGTGFGCPELAGIGSKACSCLTWESLSPSSSLPRGGSTRLMVPVLSPHSGNGDAEVGAHKHTHVCVRVLQCAWSVIKNPLTAACN